jgi:energy-coupling factor transporter transmembrane protein EcfT
LPKPLHPAARILLWCGWAAAVELAALPQLLLLAVANATAFVFSPIRAEAMRLLRRSRWLFVVLFLAYAWALPGAGVWPGLGALSPTVEGLQFGALRVARLALMLLGLAVLLALTSRARMIYGLYFLSWPLARLGFDRRAFAVRMGLTLEYVEQAPHGTRWLEALRNPQPDTAGPDTYTLQTETWQWRDSLVILAAAVFLVVLSCA